MVRSDKLTEEEQFLKKQYKLLNELKQDLKKLILKRKQQQSANVDSGPTPTKQTKAIIKGSKAPTAKAEFQFPASSKVKSVTSAEAAANTEAAKKLLKSGAIQLKVEKKTSFKRSSNLKRRLDEPRTKKPEPVELVSSTGSDDTADETLSKLPLKQSPTDMETAAKGKISNQPREVVSPKRRRMEQSEPRNRSNRCDRPFKKKFQHSDNKKGNTLYVYGLSTTRKMMEVTFARFGNIVDIKMKPEQNSGFVSFDSDEAAEIAIREMDDAEVDDCRLKVSIARHQPLRHLVATPSTDATSTTSRPWTSLALERGDKGSNEPDNRSLVSYEDDNMFQ